VIPLPLLFCCVIACCTVLVSDQCRSVNVLLSQAGQSPNPAPLLFLASQQGHDDALSLLQQYASQNSQRHWLKLAADLGSAESQYQLAMALDDPQQQQSYMDKAAQQGHPAAQYEMSLLAGQSKVKLIWLEKSAEQNYLSAQVSLYQWWLLQQDFAKAMPWLTMAAQRDGPSAIILAKQQWRSGAHNDAIDSFLQAQSLGEAEALVYLEHIRQFWSATDSATLAANGKPLLQRPNCSMRLQFIATSLDSAVQANKFLTQFGHDPNLQALPICINPLILLDQSRLNCKANWASSQRISCEIGALAEVASQVEFSHAVVFAKMGKANVHNGLMYLDLADTYQVFIHELAHFAGFVDEYPISAKMANRVCTDNSAANLLFVPQSDMQFAHTEDDVSAVSPLSHALIKSRTCDNHSAQAFKLSADLTFMEFYDRPVPPLYVDIWRQRLEGRTELIPFYVNIAQHYENKQNYSESALWWNKYKAYLAGAVK
jgi:hypothetical protein